jgi:hypothetical protein
MGAGESGGGRATGSDDGGGARLVSGKEGGWDSMSTSVTGVELKQGESNGVGSGMVFGIGPEGVPKDVVTELGSTEA